MPTDWYAPLGLERLPGGSVGRPKRDRRKQAANRRRATRARRR